MNPQNLQYLKNVPDAASALRGLGDDALKVLMDFGKQLRIPYTQPGKGGRVYSPARSLTNPPDADVLRNASQTRVMDMPRVPNRAPIPGQMSLGAAPEPRFPGPVATPQARVRAYTQNPAPEPRFPGPVVTPRQPIETFQQLNARDPGTAKSLLSLADNASTYYGVPREEVLRNIMSPQGTDYLRQLEGAGPGQLTRSPRGEMNLYARGASSPLDEVVGSSAQIPSSVKFDGGDVNYPRLSSTDGPGGALRTSPGGMLANRNVPVPESKFYMDAEFGTMPDSTDFKNAMGGIRPRDLGAITAMLGGGLTAGALINNLRSSNTDPSLGQTTAEAVTPPAFNPATPAPVSTYTDPSAGPVKQVINQAGESALREQIQQYSKGSAKPDTNKMQQDMLINVQAQREAGRALMPDILRGLGYTTNETAGLAEWARTHPELALAEYNRQIQRGSLASNLNVRSEFPSPAEIQPPDPVNYQPVGNISDYMVNTPMGSNFSKNAIGNSHYAAKAYVTGSQTATELADATQALVQPTLQTEDQYANQAPERMQATAEISNDMLRRAMELKMGKFGQPDLFYGN